MFERKQPLGVIVLQTKETREFSADEISTLTAIALQISSVVVNARLLDRINQQEAEADRVKRELAATRQRLADTQENDQESSSLAMRGHVAYPGVVSGLANILEERLGFADILDEKDIDPIEETRRLDNALEETRIQTLFLEKKMAERMSEQESSIFHTHLMILEDRGFIDRLYVGIKRT